MSLHIIIDGYNLIRQSAELSRLDRRDLQEGREALLEQLAAYRGVKHHEITVVFDGTAAPAYFQRHDRFSGVAVEFSAPGQTADTLIKKLTARKKERALVVSSDREIIRFAEQAGAAVVDSVEFERRLTRAVLLAAGDLIPEPDEEPAPRLDTKKRGPSRRLSKKERRHRKKIEKI